MNGLKTWVIDVLIKKFGPSAVRGAVLGIASWLVAKHEMLAPLGIVYDAATHILTVNLDTLSVWGVAAIPAIGAGVIKVLNHHTDEAVKAVLPTPKADAPNPPNSTTN